MNELLNDLKEYVYEIDKKINELNSKIDILFTYKFEDEYAIDVRFERSYYKEFEIGNDDIFYNKFNRLINGLDEKSIETIVIALQRLKIIRESDEPFLMLYSNEEKEYMNYLRDSFFCKIYEVTSNRFFYKGLYLPKKHFEPSVFLEKCGAIYLEKTDKRINGCIIDAGAYIGDSALVFSDMTDDKVYAFEPMEENYEMLKQTIKLNNRNNIIPYNYALTEKGGDIMIYGNDSFSTQYVNSSVSYKSKSISTGISLDQFVEENNLTVGMLKVDVEGGEQALLKGAYNTINKQKPVLLISIYHNSSDFYDIKTMIEGWNLGYRFKIRHLLQGTVMTEMVLIAEQ